MNNLPPVSATAEDGEAQVAITLRDGENTVTVSAGDGVSEAAVVGPYPLTVRANGPQIEAAGLNPNRLNTLLLDDGETEGGLVLDFVWNCEWRIAGQNIKST